MAHKLALAASPTDAAQDAARRMRASCTFVDLREADIVIALGGGRLHCYRPLHHMLESDRILPVFGMNLGTVGFLMNDWRLEELDSRLESTRAIKVNPLVHAHHHGGRQGLGAARDQ